MANYEKSWQFDTNRAVAATTSSDMGKYILWYYKAFLCGHIGGATTGLWTVAGSSDGTTGAMDGVDRWGTSFNAAKIVSGGAAASHSWVVLRSPFIKGTQLYIILRYDKNVDTQLSLFMTAAAPTGGSGTTNPTMVNAASGATTIVFFNTTNFGNFHLNSGLATDGSFFVLVSRDNTILFSSGFVGSWLGNAKPSDQYPFLVSLNQSNSGYATSSTNDISATGYTFMLPPDNSVQTSWTWAAITPDTSNLPVGSDPFDSTYVDMPIFVGSATTAIRGVRGRLQDIHYFPGGANTGTVDNTPGAPTYMIVGKYWFPTNAAPSL